MTQDLRIGQRELDAAVAAGILPQQTAIELAEFVRSGKLLQTSSEDEQFRLVSGFGDIFVTIGLALFLGALAYITSSFYFLLVPPAAWGLAEIFTKRRRMALPSMALLLAFVVSVGYAVAALLSEPDLAQSDQDSWKLAVAAAAGVAAAALHWWRFKVPITIAAGCAAAVGVVVALIQSADIEVPAIAVFLPLGLLVFALAMRFDISDRLRQTRRSDIAFWLHMLAAPLIVRPVMLMFDVTEQVDTGAALLILAVFLLLSFVALIIDRRALLVSSLLYVVYSLGALLSVQSAIRLEGMALAAAILGVGAIILLLSLAWRPLRAFLLKLMPLSITSRVPPANFVPSKPKPV